MIWDKFNDKVKAINTNLTTIIEETKSQINDSNEVRKTVMSETPQSTSIALANLAPKPKPWYTQYRTALIAGGISTATIIVVLMLLRHHGSR